MSRRRKSRPADRFEMPHAAVEAGTACIPPPVVVPAQAPGRDPAEMPVVLLDKLKARRGIDCSGYKSGHLLRRLRRRMLATASHSVEEYLALVETHPEELDALARDILITVTGFFRDAGAFAALRSQVEEICARHSGAGSDIRAWVAGCATGEEAYSIAILFAEVLRCQPDAPRVQIFATDIDDDALAVARRGLYPVAALLQSMPEDLLQRHFQPHGNTCEVGKHLRDMIVFARHNLVEDPPFQRLDLLVCRNVLIYFDNALQARVLKRLHFALRDHGVLFLGRSESVGRAQALFMTLDPGERLYRKQAVAASPPAAAGQGPQGALQTRRRDRDGRLPAPPLAGWPSRPARRRRCRNWPPPRSS